MVREFIAPRSPPSRRKSCRAQSLARWPSARPRRSGCSRSAGIFGIATFRANVFPRPAAALLILGGLVGILAGSTPYQVPLAIAVGWIGVSLMRSHQTSAMCQRQVRRDGPVCPEAGSSPDSRASGPSLLKVGMNR